MNVGEDTPQRSAATFSPLPPTRFQEYVPENILIQYGIFFTVVLF
jgi:hypothetical protein